MVSCLICDFGNAGICDMSGEKCKIEGVNEMSEETKFVDGMFVSRRDGAPDYVLCSLSFDEAKFSEFIANYLGKKWTLLIHSSLKKEVLSRT